VLEEEEIDSLVLQNMYGEIMEEEMDFGGDDFVIPSKKITKKGYPKHCDVPPLSKDG
jgi:hypothetical protein